MSDYIIRATAADSPIRAFASTTRELVEHARITHGLSPVGTAALGRLLTAAGMMGTMMKGDKDLLSIIINADGPMGKTGVTADSKANVKGYISTPEFQNPPNYFGKLDVGGAIGNGTLRVIKDMGLKEPYCGQIPLSTGNIADEITAYYAVSEQIPTVVSLGIIFGENAEIQAAGGFMVQVVPPVSDKAVRVLELNLRNMDGINSMLEQDLKPEEIALKALEGLGGDVLDKWDAGYFCDCSRERTRGVLMSLGKEEIERLAGEQEETEVCCHFCNKKYRFSAGELLKMLKE